MTTNPPDWRSRCTSTRRDGAQQITGTVTLGTTINSAVTAPRSPYGVGNAAPQAGKYTLLRAGGDSGERSLGDAGRHADARRHRLSR